MGFAYKPIPFDDLTAVHHVTLPSSPLVSLDAIAAALARDLPQGLVLLDGFPTARFSALTDAILQRFPGVVAVEAATLHRSPDQIQALLQPYLPLDRDTDPELIFGRLFDGDYTPFFDPENVGHFLASLPAGQTVLLHGPGSACELFRPHASAILYIDVTPKDAALRIFDGRYTALAAPQGQDLDALVRQAYFIDVELAVRLRKELIRDDRIDHYLLDSELSLSMLGRSAFHALVGQLKARPLRAKPVYIEGVWGGQFIRRYRNIPADLVDKVAWSFELIHTEASLLVNAGGSLLDLPFLTFMDAAGESVLGQKLHKRFGGSLPIRFNYDDTWHSSGNMSIQCHPNDRMAQELYGDFAGQNEAYYVVLTGHGAKTFCGFKGDGHAFLELCRKSETDGSLVPYEDYIQAIPSDVGRQILLPAGTVHGSGRNQLVLELGTLTYSAYTYKIYDYTRMDITGRPRPLHTRLAEQALVFERDAVWVMQHIAFPPKLLYESQGWREYLVGRYDCIYFETHRIEMQTGSRYPAENRDGFTVITIVDGEEARIQSLDDPASFYDARYLDVVLIPASIRRYVVIARGKQPVVLHKAFVREDKS